MRKSFIKSGKKIIIASYLVKITVRETIRIFVLALKKIFNFVLSIKNSLKNSFLMKTCLFFLKKNSKLL